MTRAHERGGLARYRPVEGVRCGQGGGPGAADQLDEEIAKKGVQV